MTLFPKQTKCVAASQGDDHKHTVLLTKHAQQAKSFPALMSTTGRAEATHVFAEPPYCVALCAAAWVRFLCVVVPGGSEHTTRPELRRESNTRCPRDQDLPPTHTHIDPLRDCKCSARASCKLKFPRWSLSGQHVPPPMHPSTPCSTLTAAVSRLCLCCSNPTDPLLPCVSLHPSTPSASVFSSTCRRHPSTVSVHTLLLPTPYTPPPCTLHPPPPLPHSLHPSAPRSLPGGSRCSLGSPGAQLRGQVARLPRSLAAGDVGLCGAVRSRGRGPGPEGPLTLRLRSASSEKKRG